MNVSKPKVILLIIGGLIGGCDSSEQLYEDARLSRVAAYNQWANRKQAEQRAQPYINGKLSIKDSVKLAVVHNKTLQSILEEKEIARGRLLASYSAILPSVDLAGTYTRLDEVSSFSVGGSTVTVGDVDNYSVDLVVTQPIFAGGAISAKVISAKLAKLITDQTVRKTVEKVFFEVNKVYYDVLLSRHLYQISADSVRSAQANLDAVLQKKTQGVASHFDVLRAQVELSNFKAELIKNKNVTSIAQTSLFKVMGVSQDSNVTLSDELIYVPVDTAVQEAVRVAFENRPELFEKELGIKKQRESLKTAYSRYWPSISGFYKNQWAKPDPKDSSFIEWGRAWQAGLTAVLPIFDGFGREGQVIKEKAKLRQAQIDLIDSQESVLFELKQAMLAIADADELVQSQQLNLKRAEEGMRLAEIGYKQGVNTQVEILDTRAALTKAQSLYYEAIYSHNVAKLLLLRAMGTLEESFEFCPGTPG